MWWDIVPLSSIYHVTYLRDHMSIISNVYSNTCHLQQRLTLTMVSVFTTLGLRWHSLFTQRLQQRLQYTPTSIIHYTISNVNLDVSKRDRVVRFASWLTHDFVPMMHRSVVTMSITGLSRPDSIIYRPESYIVEILQIAALNNMKHGNCSNLLLFPLTTFCSQHQCFENSGCTMSEWNKPKSSNTSGLVTSKSYQLKMNLTRPDAKIMVNSYTCKHCTRPPHLVSCKIRPTVRNLACLGWALHHTQMYAFYHCGCYLNELTEDLPLLSFPSCCSWCERLHRSSRRSLA